MIPRDYSFFNVKEPGLLARIGRSADIKVLNRFEFFEAVNTSNGNRYKVQVEAGKIKSLELTDYQEVEARNKLYAYAATKFSPGRYLDCVNDLIRKKTITTPEKIDYYASKIKGGD